MFYMNMNMNMIRASKQLLIIDYLLQTIYYAKFGLFDSVPIMHVYRVSSYLIVLALNFCNGFFNR